MDDSWPEIDLHTCEEERPSAKNTHPSSAETLVKNCHRLEELSSDFSPFLDQAVCIALLTQDERVGSLSAGSWVAGVPVPKAADVTLKKQEWNSDRLFSRMSKAWATEVLRSSRVDPYKIALSLNGRNRGYLEADALRKFISQANSVEDFLECISDLRDRKLDVPLGWMWQLRGKRSSYVKDCAQLDTSSTAAQDIKDVERDCIEINGSLMLCSKLGYDATVDTISKAISSIIVSGMGLELVPFASEEISKKLLQCANRTTSGGDAFEVLDLIACPKPSLNSNNRSFRAMACAVNEAAKPISLTVDTGVFRCALQPFESSHTGSSEWGGGANRGERRSDSGRNEGTDSVLTDWLEYGLRVVVRCDTRYALADAELVGSDTQGGGVFAEAGLRYERHFALSCATLSKMCVGQSTDSLTCQSPSLLKRLIGQELRCAQGKILVGFDA